MKTKRSYEIEAGQIVKWIAVGITAGAILPAVLVLAFFNFRTPILAALFLVIGLLATIAAVFFYRLPDRISLDEMGVVHFSRASSTLSIEKAKIRAVRWWPFFYNYFGFVVLIHHDGRIVFDWRFSGMQDLLEDFELANPDIQIPETLWFAAAAWNVLENDGA